MDIIGLIGNPETWVALLTLTVLEIVLGIDNVIFISILVQRLPADRRDQARRIGLGLAMGMRILLLLTISWIIGLTEPIVALAGREFSWRDLILISGGLFLLWKATTEIHESLEGDAGHSAPASAAASFGSVLVQVVLLDIVFSLDSVLTAVGMVDEIAIMIAAVVLAVGVMLIASGPLSKFVHEHPSVKVLALAFLLLVGVTLVADGFGLHIDKAYIYAAMAFSVFVEALNLRARHRDRAVELRPTYIKEEATGASAAVPGDAGVRGPVPSLTVVPEPEPELIADPVPRVEPVPPIEPEPIAETEVAATADDEPAASVDPTSDPAPLPPPKRPRSTKSRSTTRRRTKRS